MAYKCLYLDDQEPDTLRPYVRAVSGDGLELNITPLHPLNFSFKDANEYDCIILDWRLDEIALEGDRYEFRAASIAQEIRTRQTEGIMNPVPIILWSTYRKLTGSYFGDHTSHDLFDMVYDKDFVVDNAVRVKTEIVTIISGYKGVFAFQIGSRRKPDQLLGISESDFDDLDTSLTSVLIDWHTKPVHEIARFLFKEVVLRPGPLVSEDLLAARLGIDIHKSPQWPELLNQVDSAKYRGPFYIAWQRWWSSLIELNWWKSLDAKIPSLRSLTATQRVSLIREKTKLEDLVPAKPIRENYSEYFQTVCESDGRPLDIVDAVMVDEKEPHSWQERRYLSLDAALGRRYNQDRVRPHPIERSRLQSYTEEEED